MGTNYSKDKDTLENFNNDDKYSVTGESEFSRESTIPYDQDEVLSVRHYNLGDHSHRGKERVKVREERTSTNHRSPDFRGRGPKGYRRSDGMIKDDVSEALYRSTEVDASEIEVFVNEGNVTLKGFVTSRVQKKDAEATVEHLVGVEDVFNELRIRDIEGDVPLGDKGLMNNITGLN